MVGGHHNNNNNTNQKRGSITNLTALIQFSDFREESLVSDRGKYWCKRQKPIVSVSLRHVVAHQVEND